MMTMRSLRTLAILGLAAAGLSASGGAPAGQQRPVGVAGVGGAQPQPGGRRAANRRPVSWLGLYHPVDGAVWGGQGVPNGSSMTDAFRFGIAGVSPGVPWDRGSYRDEWEFLCNTSDLNARTRSRASTTARWPPQSPPS